MKIFSLLLMTVLFAASCQSAPPRKVEIICGGPSHLSCPVWMYCDLGEFCGGIDKEGVCRIRPEYCDDNEDFVCGCNGETYLNLCWANAKGESIRSKGQCNIDNREQAIKIEDADISN